MCEQDNHVRDLHGGEIPILIPHSMSLEKIIEKLLRGQSDANLRFDKLCHLLQARGFRMRVSAAITSSQRPASSKGSTVERINLQREGSKAKPYHIRQVRRILTNHKLL
jgi:hypothetical protein